MPRKEKATTSQEPCRGGITERRQLVLDWPAEPAGSIGMVLAVSLPAGCRRETKIIWLESQTCRVLEYKGFALAARQERLRKMSDSELLSLGKVAQNS